MALFKFIFQAYAFLSQYKSKYSFDRGSIHENNLSFLIHRKVASSHRLARKLTFCAKRCITEQLLYVVLFRPMKTVACPTT